MRNKIIGIVLAVFGIALMPSNLIPGAIILFIGCVLFVSTFKALQKKQEKQPQEPEQKQAPIPTIYTCKPAGMFAHKDEIISLMGGNYYYKKPTDTTKRIYKYRYFERECQLVPEPDNPHDPNAIKVMVDGRHIGYIPASDCQTVKTILSGNHDAPVLTLRGGDYKMYEVDEWIVVRDEVSGQLTMRYTK